MAVTNPNSRLEAFCDGVFAIAITLLIIEIKLPASHEIVDTAQFWQALLHIAPSVVAFLLSFVIILITWVNHHGTLKMITGSSSAFIFANGLLLLTVAFIPFPTALLGEYILTDHAAPAVVLYNSTLAIQAVSWILLLQTVDSGKLAKDEKSFKVLRQNRTYGYFALTFYILCAVAAIWFPLIIALVTIMIWIFWLTISIRMHHD